MSKAHAILALLLLAAPAGATEAPAPAQPVPACPGNPEALGTARTLVVGTASPVAVGLKTYPRTLDLADREVVLTFDDGPNPGTTPQVLAALRHDCVRATFFLIGRNAAVAPALVRREIAEGHTVGHHTWSHPAVTERGLTEAAARADIERGFEADDRAAYGAVGVDGPRVPFFRFPGFADKPSLLSWLGGRHIAVFGADLWASDWLVQTPDEERALLMKRLREAGRGIVLLHDIKRQTAAMLPDLLRDLKVGGFRVVAVVPGPGTTPLRPAPAGWTSATERTLEAKPPEAAARRRAPVPVGLKPMILPDTEMSREPEPAVQAEPGGAPPDAPPAP